MKIIIPGAPVPKARPRVVNGRAYTPRTTADAEDRVAWMVKSVLPADQVWPSDALWGVVARFSCGSGARGHLSDGDNLLKLVKDALNMIVWRDDRQVVDVHYTVDRGCADPRTELELWAIPEADGRMIVPAALLEQAADLIEAWGQIDDWETALEVIASLRDAAQGGPA